MNRLPAFKSFVPIKWLGESKSIKILKKIYKKRYAQCHFLAPKIAKIEDSRLLHMLILCINEHFAILLGHKGH